MHSQFYIVIALGIYFIVLDTESLRRKGKSKTDLGKTPLNNASYYWPFNEMVGEEGEKVIHDVRKKNQAYVRNNAKMKPVKQLGHALELDGTDQWVDIKKLADPCIGKLSCPTGLSVGFWINFKTGDYILAAGGYTEMTSENDELYGFRLQRDKNTRYHTLEVANGKYKWQIYIEPFPSNRWVYLSFSWEKDSGLKLYFNGRLTFTSNRKVPLHRDNKKRNNERNMVDSMVIGRKDNLQLFNNSGKFMIAHLAIWKEVLTQDRFAAAYSANVVVSPVDHVCCYQVNYKNPCEIKHTLLDNLDCICPNYMRQDSFCDNVIQEEMSSSSCGNTLEYCRELVTNQDYCDAKNSRYPMLCKESCGRCGATASSRTGPRQHFSEKTLIFALLGCVGGLVILFGVTVYFWKVYRTRYQGAFVPPVKTVSLLDVSDYEDEKWPNKYIDSAAYYIKDVPPKKRALPLIPAKMTHNNIYRYQPPEFD